MTAALAVLAMTYAGVLVWFHGVYVGMRDNDLAVVNAQRKVDQLRGQVAILEMGLTIPTDIWAEFDGTQR